VVSAAKAAAAEAKAEATTPASVSLNRSFGNSSEGSDIPDDLVLALEEQSSGEGSLPDVAEVPEIDAAADEAAEAKITLDPLVLSSQTHNAETADDSLTGLTEKASDSDRPTSVRGTESTLELGDKPADFEIDEVAAINDQHDIDHPADPTDEPTELQAALDAVAEARTSTGLLDDEGEVLNQPLPSLDPDISALAANASARMKENAPKPSKVFGAANADREVLDESLDQTQITDDSVTADFEEGAQALRDTKDKADKVEAPTLSDDELAFLDASISDSREEVIEQQREVLHQKDALTEELERQADTWLPSDAPPAPAADDLPLQDASNYVSTADAEAANIDTDAADVSGGAGMAAAGAAAVAAGSALATRSTDTEISKDYSASGAAAVEDISSGGAPSLEQAELLSGKGRLYRVFSNGPNDTRAVKRGLSWPAMFFTLPWLFVKRMPGTAIVYALMAVMLLAGLLISGINWLDASGSGGQTAALWAIAFAVLSFIGLILVPLFLANRWHADSLKGRGYKEIATVRAINPSSAVDRIMQLAA